MHALRSEAGSEGVWLIVLPPNNTWKMAVKGDLNILFIGAGAVNFGGAAGPWDHSRRLEKLGGVKIVAIADPDLPRAKAVLEQKLSENHADMYKDCVVVGDYKEALSMKPHVAFIG